MQTSQVYIPSELMCHHVFPELSPATLLNSVSGVNQQLTQLVTEDIAQTINSHTPLADISDKIESLDQLFRLVQTYPESHIHYLDYTNLEEKPFYFIAQEPTSLICHDSLGDEELEKIRVFGERRKLKNLKGLHLKLGENISFVHQQTLDSIFLFSRITSLTIKYQGQAANALPFNLLEILPQHLTQLTLHNAGLTAKSVEAFHSQKFKKLIHLDLSHNSLLNSIGIARIFEANLPQLEALILNHMGVECYLGPIIVNHLSLKNLTKLSLTGTHFAQPQLLITQFKNIKKLKKLSITLLGSNSNPSFITELKEALPELKLTLDNNDLA